MRYPRSYSEKRRHSLSGFRSARNVRRIRMARRFWLRDSAGSRKAVLNPPFRLKRECQTLIDAFSALIENRRIFVKKAELRRLSAKFFINRPPNLLILLYHILREPSRLISGASRRNPWQKRGGGRTRAGGLKNRLTARNDFWYIEGRKNADAGAVERTESHVRKRKRI